MTVFDKNKVPSLYFIIDIIYKLSVLICYDIFIILLQ